MDHFNTELRQYQQTNQPEGLGEMDKDRKNLNIHKKTVPLIIRQLQSHAEPREILSCFDHDYAFGRDDGTKYPVRHYLLPEWRGEQIGWHCKINLPESTRQTRLESHLFR